MTDEPGTTGAASDAAGTRMRSEILEQPDRLHEAVELGLGPARAVADALRARAPRAVLLAGRGTSDHACLYAKYLVEVSLGLPAGMMSPSTLTAYGARPAYDDVLVVVVSQSGTSPDLLETAEVARECGATVLAVTNTPSSALTSVAHHALAVHAGPELAVAATKSYTAELMALWLLVDAWRGGDGASAAAVPGAVRASLRRADDVRRLADRLRFAGRLAVTGRGYAYPTAREAALKVMETSYLAAHAFSGADLLHGPVAMIDRDHPVLAVVPDGVGAAAMAPVLARLRESAADVTVVGGPATATGEGDVLLDHGLPEELAPMADVVALQLLALEMALARGHDPDRPRGLAKETSTW